MKIQKNTRFTKKIINMRQYFMINIYNHIRYKFRTGLLFFLGMIIEKAITAHSFYRQYIYLYQNRLKQRLTDQEIHEITVKSDVYFNRILQNHETWSDHIIQNLPNNYNKSQSAQTFIRHYLCIESCINLIQ